jgi:hypothetical protein
MSRNDEPGPVPWFGTMGSIDAHEQGTAPGSDAQSYQAEGSAANTVIGHVTVTSSYVSSQVPPGRAPVDVTADATAAYGAYPDREPFTKADISSTSTFPGKGSPDSHVVSPRHPNSLPIGGERT